MSMPSGAGANGAGSGPLRGAKPALRPTKSRLPGLPPPLHRAGRPCLCIPAGPAPHFAAVLGGRRPVIRGFGRCFADRVAGIKLKVAISPKQGPPLALNSARSAQTGTDPPCLGLHLHACHRGVGRVWDSRPPRHVLGHLLVRQQRAVHLRAGLWVVGRVLVRSFPSRLAASQHRVSAQLLGSLSSRGERKPPVRLPTQ